MTQTDDADITLELIKARDGTQLAIHRLKSDAPDARTLVLMHGLFSSAEMNWIKFGHAATLSAAGFDLIMPDLRAHGLSGAPHDPDNYPPAVLVHDLEDTVAHYRLADYDLAGFSLGSRTSLGGVLAGLTPRRLALIGMGLEGLLDFERRASFFVDAIDNFETARRGDQHFFAVSFMKSMKVDRVAARCLLSANMAFAADDLPRAAMPTLVLCGTEDRDNGSPTALAEALPQGEYREIPGTHMSSVTEKALGRELASFLKE